VKFPWGKQVNRRFHKSDVVRSVYAFASMICSASDKDEDKGFDLFTAYPSMSLLNSLAISVQDAGIAGSQVIMRYNV
jgi:hypothetical protein